MEHRDDSKALLLTHNRAPWVDELAYRKESSRQHEERIARFRLAWYKSIAQRKAIAAIFALYDAGGILREDLPGRCSDMLDQFEADESC